MSLPDHQADNNTKTSLDDVLTKLADVLRAMGVEELSVDEHYQHHIINTDLMADKALVNDFCRYVTTLHGSLTVDK